MSRERELLERVLNLWDTDDFIRDNDIEEIRDYLAQPEKKREALRIDQKYSAWRNAKLYGCSCRFSFFAGIRLAERHHGIGEE